MGHGTIGVNGFYAMAVLGRQVFGGLNALQEHRAEEQPVAERSSGVC
ncbi:MAG: hypothetical protein KDA96_19145 [Planctomycetaceae bacterium]|nr:hypothetical protein [Planctomycetaceae bacterium]